MISFVQQDAERSRRLAESLLQRMYPFDEIEVRLGTVPPEWPAFATPPEHATVIGSVIRRRDGTLSSIATYLEDVPSDGKTLDHYGSVLGRERWSAFDPQPPGPAGGGGFRSAALNSTSARVFCRTERDPFFSVGVAARAGRNDAVVTWDAGLDHHPQRARLGPDHPGGVARLVPDLAAPAGVPVQGGGGGGSDSEWELRARAITTMDVAALATHYREQLRHADWTLRDEGGDAVVRWSRWTLREEDYVGMFVAAVHLPELRDLTLIIRSPSRSSRGWRMWSGASTRSVHYPV